MTKKTTQNNTAKKSLIWRLQKQLSLDEVERMLDKNIIDEEEAKELLFNLSDNNKKVKELEKANEALQEQIEFLQGVVDKLSSRQSPQIIYKYIEDWEPKYPKFPRTPYWMNTGTGIGIGGNTITAEYNSLGMNSVTLASSIMDTVKTNMGTTIS